MVFEVFYFKVQIVTQTWERIPILCSMWKCASNHANSQSVHKAPSNF